MMSEDYGYDDELPSGSEADDPGGKTWLLTISGAATVIAAALLPVSGLVPHIAGYVLASLVAFTLVALYRRAAVSRFLLVGIGTTASVNSVAVGLLAAGFVVAVAHAYAIARHFA